MAAPTAMVEPVDASEDPPDSCRHTPLLLLEFKMVFVGCLGTAVALLSMANNLVLLHAFVTSCREMNSRRNLTYLTGLSVCDILISFFYVFIMSIQVYAEYFEWTALFAAWHYYLPVAFTLSNITITAASFLLVAAALERYLLTIRGAKSTAGLMLENRRYAALCAILIAVVMKGTIVFEIEVYHNEECGDGMAGRGVTLSALAQNPIYDSVWRFWSRRILTIFLPFFVLAYCNLAIVYSTERAECQRKRLYGAHNVAAIIIKKLSVHRKASHIVTKMSADAIEAAARRNRRASAAPRVRSATRMLIIVVACYLVANALDVILAAWEYFDAASLVRMSRFYTVATDVSSLLSVCSSALRLPIYFVAGDKLLKAEIRRSLACLLRALGCATSRGGADMSALARLRDSIFLPYQPLIVIVKHQDAVQL